MKKIYSVLFLACLALTVYSQQVQINTATEINKLAMVQELPAYWDGTAVRQFSSYDTTGNNDDGFSGKYSFIRKNPDNSLVIFEAKGNGVINRIWTPTPTNDTLDFYFSGSARPSYSIRFSDLYSGKVFPFIAPLTGNELGGYFCYLPIPFTNGCKVVLRGNLQFYQIQYRSYPNNYLVSNFNGKLDEPAKTALENIGSTWKNTGKFKSKPVHVETTLSPGKSVTLADLNQNGRITGIRLYHADAFRGLNKLISIKMTWDNEQPAVYMPVADFFGYAFGKESMQSLLLGSADNINYSYFPMPFAKKAKIELVYQPDEAKNTRPVQIEADIFVDEKKYDPAKEGKFYAYWNAEKTTKEGQPHIFLEGKGKGHYVGTILQAQGLNPGMTLFFEGDDVTTIDGEMRMHGTGSEDYFNGGWYALLDRWDRKMSLPLHGSLDYSLPFARTGAYRLFISDKMPFEKEITTSIEHGPENNNKPGDYTSVALYYAGKAITGKQPEPAGALVKVYLPDTMMVYPQLMQYSIGGAVKIDGNILQSTTGGEVKIDLSELPKGRYKLSADVERSDDGADISIWQRQKMITEFSFNAGKRENLPDVYICNIELDDFKNAITLHFRRSDKKSVVNIHRLILDRQ